MRRGSLWWGLGATAAVLAAAGCTSLKSGSQPADGGAIATPTAASSRGAGTPALEDPTSLAFKGPKPGADLFVASAVVYEQSGNLEAAAGQYQRALKADPDNLPALLGYAKLQDAQHEFAAADKLYQQAAKKHAKDAALYNDWGLSYLRRSQFDDAAKMLSKAVMLQPHKPLYHNNLATVLVETGHPNEAYRQLAAAQAPAVAHYNLGILLHRKGQDELAQRHFQLAVEADPTLVPARQWAERLAASARSAPFGATAKPAPASVAVIQPPPLPVPDAMPPEASAAAGPAVPASPAPSVAQDGAPQSILVAPVERRPASSATLEASGNPPSSLDGPPVDQRLPAPPLEIASRPPLPENGVRYPQSLAPALAQEGDVPPAPCPLRALPPVSSAAPLPLPPIE